MRVKLKDNVSAEEFERLTFGGKILDIKNEYEDFKNSELTSRLKGEIYEVESDKTAWEYENEHYKLLFEEVVTNIHNKE